MWWILLSLVLVGFFLPGCPCCGTCTIYSDTFNDLSGWTQDAGSWSVSSNVATVSSTAAFLRCNTTNPDGTGKMQVQVQVKGTATGDLIRIIVAYVDSSNYHFAEMKWGTSGYLRLYKRSSGSDTQLATQTITYTNSTFVTFTVCLTAALDYVYVFDSLGNAIGSTTTVPGSATGFALGTGGTLTGTANFYIVTAASTAVTCPPCQQCGHCIVNTAALTYQAVITGIANGTCSSCGSLNGTWVLPNCGHYQTPSLRRESDVCLYNVKFTALCGLYNFWMLQIDQNTALATAHEVQMAATAFVPDPTCNSEASDIGILSQFYLQTGSSAQDCGYSGLNLPSVAADAACHWGAATCTVTKIL